MDKILDKIDAVAAVDILEKGKETSRLIGRPFYIDYERMFVLVADAWKHQVQGVPQGAFLLAFYDGEEEVEEAILLRALRPAKLPTDPEVVSSMIEYYKDGMDIAGRAGAQSRKEDKLDHFTRYEFSFSGLECRILGAFYRAPGQSNGRTITEFGADLENFYSANNYSVYKPTAKVLERIVNQRDGNGLHGHAGEVRIGKVRYSSSRRFQQQEEKVEVFISPKDFLGKRTALFGMTRTGKSNSVKKIIEATVQISQKAKGSLSGSTPSASAAVEQNLEAYDKEQAPKYPVGQIIFDVNGEYANANMQDDGTAIFELFRDDVIRYSVMPKEGFKVMKVNFYGEVEAGFELIQNYFEDKGQSSDYLNNFLAVDLNKPDDYEQSPGSKVRYHRKLAAYLCCLRKAGFTPNPRFNVNFQGNKILNPQVTEKGIFPERGISLDDAIIWFEKVWENYETWPYFIDYKKKYGTDWADDDLKSILAMLTRKKQPNSTSLVSGWRKLKVNELLDLHTNQSQVSFEQDISQALQQGKIVIVDLSQGSPVVKNMFSEKLCRRVFQDAMQRFIAAKPNNFIQFYFEEAHNLFPKKEDKDLSQIYNRIAKEGAKLNLGLLYATQEVSSISSNILKNTQNWFIAHLNNEEELRELRKYYDFGDFVDSLLRFSAGNDKGFVRMKTYSNPYVVPVQVDRFLA